MYTPRLLLTGVQDFMGKSEYAQSSDFPLVYVAEQTVLNINLSKTQFSRVTAHIIPMHTLKICF